MSRLLFFLLGAGAATWYTHSHQGRFYESRWNSRSHRREEPWQYHDANEATAATYTEPREMAARRKEEFQDKAAQIGDTALDTMLELTEAIRAKLAAARGERERYRQSVDHVDPVLPRSRSTSDPGDRRI